MVDMQPNQTKNHCMDTSSDKWWKFHKITWTCLRRGNLRRETESLLTVTQNNAIRNNCVKVDNIQKNSKCRLCGDWNEIVNHISECSKLAKKEYKSMHDWVRKVIH